MASDWKTIQLRRPLVDRIDRYLEGAGRTWGHGSRSDVIGEALREFLRQASLEETVEELRDRIDRLEEELLEHQNNAED